MFLFQINIFISCIFIFVTILPSFNFFISGELIAEDTDEIRTVAVKVLKDSANKEAEEDFLREVEIMSAFRHPNILSLLGVVLKGLYMFFIG